MKYDPGKSFDFYYEDPCYVCAGLGRIAVIKKPNYPSIPSSEICPLCNGRGYLKIQKGDLEL